MALLVDQCVILKQVALFLQASVFSSGKNADTNFLLSEMSLEK